MKSFYLIIIFTLVTTYSFSQITLSLLNGRKLSLESYVKHEEDAILEYNYQKHSGKTRKFYSDYNDIYSMNIGGKDSIFYVPENEESYNIEEMGRVVFGMQEAEQHFKPWWAFVAGTAVAGGSLFLPTYGTVKIVVPVGYFAGMIFVKPSKSNVYRKYPQFAGDALFAYGYQRKARIKILKNTAFGMLAGFAISGATLGIINIAK
ncbi:MAG: hypothetical protein LBV69_08220 [Bacteroidales bacterium]|nr:hypothetical protein [Bacteroidales bacterium]